MLTAVKLVDQWAELERRLPAGWDAVALRLQHRAAGGALGGRQDPRPDERRLRRGRARVHGAPGRRSVRPRGGSASVRTAGRGSDLVHPRAARRGRAAAAARRARDHGVVVGRRVLGRRPRGASARVERPALRARARFERLASAGRPALRRDQPHAGPLAGRVHVPLRPDDRLWRVARHGAAVLRRARRGGHRRHGLGAPVALRRPTTSPRRAPSGTSAARSSTRPRSSAPNRSASAATIRSRRVAASSSVSVRSGAWKARWSATDFRPSPTCAPR